MKMRLVILAVLTILPFVIKNANQHVARAVPLVVFTSLFYKDNLFTFFAVVLFIIMIFSAFYMKIRKNEIFNGIVIGILASLAGYYGTNFLV